MRRTLLAVTTALLALSACTNAERSVGEVCDRLVAPLCEYRIRCMDWAGSQEDCERVERFECCRDAACEARVIADDELLDTCAASIRGAVCEPGGPALSEACEDAVRPVPIDAGPPPGFDAGPPPTDAGTDAGPTDRLYEECSSDDDCPGTDRCAALPGAAGAGELCTHACASPDDTRSCPGGHCVRVTVRYGTGPFESGIPTCLEACTPGGSDCRAGWECISTSTGFDVCHPMR